jgi:site-specific DNA recombinase
LIVPGPESVRSKPARRDEKLVALVAGARQARELVLANPEQSIAIIAKGQGRCRARLTRLVAISCLAPDIVIAIVEGKQPEHFTANRLTSIALPLSWAEQRAALGFS